MQSLRHWLRLVEIANHPDPRNNPAFTRWFGKSKVVDATGRPLPVFHGTRDSIKAFGDQEDQLDRGGLIAFFSTSSEFASDYATGGSINGDGTPHIEGSNVIPVYLRIERPFDYRVDWHEANWFWDQTGGIADKWEANRILTGLGHQIENISDTDTPDLTEAEFVQAVKSGSWDALEAPEFVRYLHQDGYDGIIMLENGAVNYGIFSPQQVKSVFSRRYSKNHNISL